MFYCSGILSYFSIILISLSESNEFNLTRTFHAREVDIKEVPFLALIIAGDKSTCTGCLIHDQWVITAAHCFIKKLSDTIVVVGTSDRQQPGGKQFTVEEHFIHPSFLVETFGSLFDIALLKLTSPVKENDKAKIIKMDVEDWPQNVTKRQCFVVGYGLHRHLDRSGRLHGGQVNLGKGPSPYENCPAAFHHTRQFMWSYNNESEPLCFGDSGAPIICDGKTHGIAVLSFPCFKSEYKVDCSELYVDAYVMLRNHLPWIKEHLPCAPDCTSASSFIKIHLTHMLWCILSLLNI